MSEKLVNYTTKEIETIEAFANEHGGTINYELANALADKLGRKVASVRSKLTNMGIYQKKGKTTKSGDPVERKEQIAQSIEALVEREFPGLADLPKETLKGLREVLAQKAVA